MKDQKDTIIVNNEDGAQVHNMRKQKKQLQLERGEMRSQNTKSPLNVFPDDTVLEWRGAGKSEEIVSLDMILQKLHDLSTDHSDQLK